MKIRPEHMLRVFLFGLHINARSGAREEILTEQEVVH